MIRVQQEDFDIGAETTRLTAGNTAIGGVVTFVGLVRDFVGKVRADGEPIAAMTLEHYPGMTERKLAEIEAEANKRWPLNATLIIHRTGKLMPGDRIVMVACAAAHREDAFSACQFLIDWLKTQAPFWKLEDTASGPRWVNADARDDALAARWVKTE
jgi:molybdopterin synthase catalytic subunit